MSAAQMWYVKHRPDLLLLSPCDAKDPLDGAMFIGIDQLHSQSEAPAKWKHPMSVAYATCYGDPAKQVPFVCKCTCKKDACILRSAANAPLDAAIPIDWMENFVIPEKFEVSAARKEQAISLWLDCTGKVDRELSASISDAEGADAPLPNEELITKQAYILFTDYLKGRVCFSCNLPSTKMQVCSKCRNAHYCSRDCQRGHWAQHKESCKTA